MARQGSLAFVFVVSIVWVGGFSAARGDSADDVRAAAIAAAVAVRGEDFAALDASVTADAGQMRLWQATLKQRAALRQLERLTAALGTGPLGDVGLSGLAEVEAGALRPAQLRVAKLEIHGDRAVMTEVAKEPPGTFTHELRRVGGRWKLVRPPDPGITRDVDGVIRKRERDTAEIRKIAEKARTRVYADRAAVRKAVRVALGGEGGEGEVIAVGPANSVNVLNVGPAMTLLSDPFVAPPKRGKRFVTIVLLDQLAYEQAMVSAAADVVVRVGGGDPARAKRLGAAEEKYQAEWLTLRTNRFGEMAAAVADLSDNRAAVDDAGLEAMNPILLARLDRHAAMYREMLEIARRYRRGVEEVFTPEERHAWSATLVRARLRPKYATLVLLGSGKDKFDRFVEEIAGPVAGLGEPRDFMAVDEVIYRVWEANRAKFMGAP